MSISILIVNWNSANHLRKCLESIRSACSDLLPQIVVVDGGSFDACAEMLASEFPEVDFVQSQTNVGFGRANNLGFQKVSGDVVLLLNPDTELSAGAVQSLLTNLVSLPAAGIVSPRLLNSDGSLQESCVQALPTPLNQAFDLDILRGRFPQWRVWGNYRAFAARKPVEVEAVSGACMLLRSEVFQRLGGFSPQFFMYGEDMDLCSKVQKAGLKVYHVPCAQVVHHGGGSSSGEFSRFSVVLMRHSIFVYIRMHQGWPAAIAYRLLMAIGSFMRVLILAPLCLLRTSHQKRAPIGGFKKWLSVLRWSAGLDRWVEKYT